MTKTIRTLKSFAGVVFLGAGLMLPSAGALVAGPEDEVRAVFSKFAAAQNAHDLNAIGEILQNSPQLIWITRGAPVWGREAVLKRFEDSFRGTWVGEPKFDELKVVELAPGVAQVFVPAMFRIAPPGQTAQPSRFLLNQIYVKEPSGWKLASIFPILVP
jgi:uncharacterized protein (TIGR02246 family)